ncbi:hypothetical protein SFUMM280S_02266 [Streptomyces fumanus]
MAVSRATPRMDRQSPRLAVTAMSSTSSTSSSSSMASLPTSVSGGSTMMPWVPSSPMPSSSLEQIMPCETLP